MHTQVWERQQDVHNGDRNCMQALEVAPSLGEQQRHPENDRLHAIAMAPAGILQLTATCPGFQIIQDVPLITKHLYSHFNFGIQLCTPINYLNSHPDCWHAAPVSAFNTPTCPRLLHTPSTRTLQQTPPPPPPPPLLSTHRCQWMPAQHAWRAPPLAQHAPRRSAPHCCCPC